MNSVKLKDVRINIQKSVALLNTSNASSEKENKKTVPLTTAAERKSKQKTLTLYIQRTDCQRLGLEVR